jgi:hypothetical protein
MNDTFVALALNGPSHEHAGKYSEREEDIQQCVRGMVGYCRMEGLPWLERWSDPNALLLPEGSPLRPEDQQALSNALAGRVNVQAVAQSESLLGLQRSATA